MIAPDLDISDIELSQGELQRSSSARGLITAREEKTARSFHGELARGRLNDMTTNHQPRIMPIDLDSRL
jgi:hypothetical protein